MTRFICEDFGPGIPLSLVIRMPLYSSPPRGPLSLQRLISYFQETESSCALADSFYLLIYLFSFGCARSSLLLRSFLAATAGATLVAGNGPPHCGLSGCRAQASRRGLGSCERELS